MATNEEAAYAAFQEKVKRTVYIDNLSPQVTEPILKTALDQFGMIKSVHFIPNYIISENLPQCALVEMENETRANNVLSTVNQHPFMICGMPRPVRARPAEIGMFPDVPSKPGRSIKCRWVDPKSPEYETVKKLKKLTQKHSSEATFLLKKQLEEEEDLAAKQKEILKHAYNKYEMLEALMNERIAQRLANHYRLNLRDH